MIYGEQTFEKDVCCWTSCEAAFFVSGRQGVAFKWSDALKEYFLAIEKITY